MKILVVDDDTNHRKTLCDILKIKGYEVMSAENGATGIAQAQRSLVNVALIDLSLPDISGIEVMKNIKANSPLIEAIILTGNASPDIAVDAINRGAFSCLLKPYLVEDLLRDIRHAAERNQARTESRV